MKDVLSYLINHLSGTKVLIKLGEEPKTVEHELSVDLAELLILEHNMTPVHFENLNFPLKSEV